MSSAGAFYRRYTTWDERFRRGDYPADPDPTGLLRRRVDTLPDGRALDVATGTGHNAVDRPPDARAAPNVLSGRRRGLCGFDALFGADG